MQVVAQNPVPTKSKVSESDEVVNRKVLHRPNSEVKKSAGKSKSSVQSTIERKAIPKIFALSSNVYANGAPAKLKSLLIKVNGKVTEIKGANNAIIMGLLLNKAVVPEGKTIKQFLIKGDAKNPGTYTLIKNIRMGVGELISYAGGFDTESSKTIEININDQITTKDSIQFSYRLRFHKQDSQTRVNNLVEEYIKERAAGESASNKDIIRKTMFDQMTKMQSSDAYSNDSLGISGTISTKIMERLEEIIKVQKKTKSN